MSDLLARFQAALSDRYIVERELGRGGMATVFLARDVKQDRQVAIKLLYPELAAALGPERFRREIQIATHLTHPHILPIYDSGEATDSLFYVMPFVEGESLRARLDREQQLSVDEAIRVTCEVAAALDYAHRHGIIHRDIKPENILFEDGHAVVADFGIARAISASADDNLTKTGLTLGTPAYMSPEQGVGDRHIDGRSDLYSLACVLYEMLAGQPPFLGANARAIIARHTLDEVPSLSSVRGTIPEEIEDAIMRALSKVPADRFATVAEFASALNAGGDGSPRRITRRATARRQRVSRSRRALLALAIIPVLAAGYGAWRLWIDPVRASGAATLENTLDPRRVAVTYFEDQSTGHELGYLANGLTDALIDELGTVRTLDVISSAGVQPFRGQEISADSIGGVLKTGTVVFGSVAPLGDRVRVVVRLVDANSGADFKRASFERPTGDLLALRDSLTQQVARFLRERLGEEIQLRRSREGTQNVQAWALAQRARKVRDDAEELVHADDHDGAAASFERADSLLARAETLDPEWGEPIIARGTIASRRVRLAAGTPDVAATFAKKGLAHAERALKLTPKSADALELRGTLRYMRYLLHLEPDHHEAANLLKIAEQDLRAAVATEPSQAGAWNVLSHLYFLKSDLVEGQLAARRAYEEDAYLASTPEILWRLFTASYEFEQFADAAHWCEEGRRRFPHEPRFVKCELLLLTARTNQPDVPAAWTLAGELLQLTPASTQEYQRRESRMVVAAVLARAGLRDSATRVIEHSRGNAEIDPTRELLSYEAFAQTLLGNRDAAISLIKQFLAANPEHRAGMARYQGWWWRDLRDDPRFKELVETGG